LVKDIAVDHAKVEGHAGALREIFRRPVQVEGPGKEAGVALVVTFEEGVPILRPGTALQKEGRGRCPTATAAANAGLGEGDVAVDRTRVVAIGNVRVGANAELSRLDNPEAGKSLVIADLGGAWWARVLAAKGCHHSWHAKASHKVVKGGLKGAMVLRQCVEETILGGSPVHEGSIVEFGEIGVGWESGAGQQGRHELLVCDCFGVAFRNFQVG